MKRANRGTLGTGLTLIGLGIVFVVAWLIGWDKAWPIFPLFAGVAFWAGYFLGGRRDPGLTWIGTVALLLGVFFFGFTLKYLEWADMGTLWPVFPLIGGVAWVVEFLASRARRVGSLAVGLAALVIGVVGLAYNYKLIQGPIVNYWPLLIILMGVAILVGGLARAVRRQ